MWRARHPGDAMGRTAAGLAAVAVLGASVPVGGQTGPAPGPRTAQPERPSVATHAYTVAPGWIEIEAGFVRQPDGALADRVAVPLVVKVGLGSRVQLDIAPGWQRDAEKGQVESGITDLLAALKWRLVDDAPLLGAFAVQATVSLPTGSADAGRGTGSAGLNVLAISSHALGAVALDANVGYTRFGGDGTIAPQNSTLWAVAAGFPIAGRLEWTLEVFGLPGTSGSAGTRPVVALLTGASVTVRPCLVLDAGAILDIEGFGGTAVFAGATWNVGRLWGRPLVNSTRTIAAYAP